MLKSINLFFLLCTFALTQKYQKVKAAENFLQKLRNRFFHAFQAVPMFCCLFYRLGFSFGTSGMLTMANAQTYSLFCTKIFRGQISSSQSFLCIPTLHFESFSLRSLIFNRLILQMSHLTF